MKIRLFQKKSILRKMLALMLAALTIMFAILYCTIFYGGMTEQIRQSAFDILNERVTGRKNNLQNELIVGWQSLNESAALINQNVQGILEANGAQYTDLSAGSELATRALEAASDRMIYTLRRNSVCGVFLIFNGSQPATPPLTGDTQQRAGFCVRDYDPKSDPGDYSDLQLYYAPTALSKSLGITLDAYWKPQYKFTAEKSADYYYKPYQAALEAKGADPEDLVYWCPAYTDEDGAPKVISCSVPLLDQEGNPYAILGIEFTTDYLSSKLPYSEINGNNNQGSYLLAVSTETADYYSTASSGPFAKRIFSSNNLISLQSRQAATDCYLVDTGGRISGDAYACLKPLKLYNTNTPFVNEKWVLIGAIEDQYLLSLYNSIQQFLLIVLAIVFLIGLTSFTVVCVRFARPITMLAQEVRGSDPRKPVRLRKVNLKEIDELSSSIESLSQNVADSYSRLSKIMNVAGFQVAAFENFADSDDVIYTDSLFDILGIPEPPPRSGKLPNHVFENVLHNLTVCNDEASSDDCMFCVKTDGETRWVRLKLVQNEQKTLGVVSDVTMEYAARKKLEYERDYDLLTKLLNRRAFQSAIDRAFSQRENLKIAAMVMLDLDNLKYINDTYGHDCGDQYICLAASVLHKHASNQVLTARMSGDEFLIFLTGDHRAELELMLRNIEGDFIKTDMELPDGTHVHVRLSAGVAWYPDDSDDSAELAHFADFAMYQVKHSTKGLFASFNAAAYQQESFLLRNKDELERIIDGELLSYHFQPIVNLIDGSIFAYEALMRPMSDALRTPLDLLALAKTQSKLYNIERLTWKKALEGFSAQSPIDEDCRIFINSIADQLLTENDIHFLQQTFAPYLGRIVVELTEEEKSDPETIAKKWIYIGSWGAEVALDDYGTGYNGDAILLSSSPQYVKIDRMIVQNLNADAKRLQIVQSILAYAQQHDLRVIAEGVETPEELETLVRIGVHFIQGYYLAKPHPKLQALPQEKVDEIMSIPSPLRIAPTT